MNIIVDILLHKIGDKWMISLPWLRRMDYTQPYARVYVDDHGYAVAVDRNNKVIVNPNKDHSFVIQKSIDIIKNGVILAIGNFKLNRQIIIRSGIELDFAWSLVTPQSNFDIFYIERDAKLRRVVVDLTSIDIFDKSVILLNGKQKYGASHNTKIDGIRVISDGKGTAIHMLCDSNDQYISWVTISDVETERMEYVVKMQVLNSDPSAWINGNRFIDIRDFNSKYMIWMERNTDLGVYESGINKNTFIGLRYQAGSLTRKVIRVQGLNNMFIDSKIWDMQIAPDDAVAIDFDSDAQLTWFEGSVDTNYVVDNGVGNRILNILDKDIFFISKSPTKGYFIFDSALYSTNIIGANTIQAGRFLTNFSDYDWAIIIKSNIEEYPRLRIGSTGTISFGNGTEPPIPVLINDNGKLKIDNAEYVVIRYPTGWSDTDWSFVTHNPSETYPRLRISPTGTISFSDGSNSPNIVIQNISGKARIYNVDSIQVPLYNDCSNVPASGNFAGDIRVCYDTSTSKWVIKIWDGSTWQTIG